MKILTIQEIAFLSRYARYCTTYLLAKVTGMSHKAVAQHLIDLRDRGVISEQDIQNPKVNWVAVDKKDKILFEKTYGRLKRCKKCNNVGQVLDFPPDINGFGGVSDFCSSCMKNTKIFLANGEADMRTMQTKTCDMCGKTKYLRAFRKVFGKHFLKTCKQCEKKQAAGIKPSRSNEIPKKSPPPKEVGIEIEKLTVEQIQKLMRFGDHSGVVGLSRITRLTLSQTQKALKLLKERKAIKGFDPDTKDFEIFVDLPNSEKQVFFRFNGDLKVCRDCKAYLPYSEFNKDSYNFGKVKHVCKKCEKEAVSVEEIFKTCVVCKKIKIPEDFPKVNKKYRRRQCKKCYSKQQNVLQQNRRNKRNSPEILTIPAQADPENLLVNDIVTESILGDEDMKNNPFERKETSQHHDGGKRTCYKNVRYPVGEEKITGCEKKEIPPETEMAKPEIDSEYEEAKAFIYMLETFFTYTEVAADVDMFLQIEKTFHDIAKHTKNKQIEKYLAKTLRKTHQIKEIFETNKEVNG